MKVGTFYRNNMIARTAVPMSTTIRIFMATSRKHSPDWSLRKRLRIDCALIMCWVSPLNFNNLGLWTLWKLRPRKADDSPLKGELVWLESDWLQIADDHQEDRNYEHQDHQDSQDKWGDFDQATLRYFSKMAITEQNVLTLQGRGRSAKYIVRPEHWPETNVVPHVNMSAK